MLWITESPWAASAASSIAMPARMSGLSTTPPWSGAGPAITARCGSHSTMRAPMPISLSTKKSRDSNSFSKISRIPSHCDATTIAIDMRSAGKAGHGPSSSFGTCPPRSGRIRRSWPASTISWVPSRRGRTPSRSNPNRILRRSSLRTPSITIDGVRSEDLRSILLGFERLGVRPRLDGTQLIVDAGQERRIRPDLGGHVPKLEDGPWPAFPADLMSIAIVVATQCEGLLLVFEKLFESRLFFVDKLIGMGARIVLCDPHRAVIAGPAPLHGGVVESPDIRAGMAMLLAALAAQGDSVIHNIGQIERGYERIDERLRAVGAQIERVDGQAGS